MIDIGQSNHIEGAKKGQNFNGEQEREKSVGNSFQNLDMNERDGEPKRKGLLIEVKNIQ